MMCYYLNIQFQGQRVNHLKPGCFFTYYKVWHSKNFRGARLAFSVLYGSQNRQRLLLYTSLRIGFYNRGGKCLQRGTDWFLIYSRLRFVFKRLNSNKQRKVTTEVTMIVNWYRGRLKIHCGDRNGNFGPSVVHHQSRSRTSSIKLPSSLRSMLTHITVTFTVFRSHVHSRFLPTPLHTYS